MKHYLALLVGVLLAGVAGCQRGPNVAYYFPTQLGDSWVYDVDGAEVGYTVRGVEEQDGAKVVTVARVWEGGKFTLDTTDTFLVSTSGVFVMTHGHSRFEPPVCKLKLPHVTGGKWEELDPRAGLEWLKYMNTAHGPEEVTVPAGTFRAIRIESECTRREGPPERVTKWYAPGVGQVKSVQVGLTRLMKSFRPGKQ